MLPRVAAEKLAEYCDIFCERGYFDVAASRRILSAAKKLGLAFGDSLLVVALHSPSRWVLDLNQTLPASTLPMRWV